jgi:starch-binding outer membrane protein, SusD/RagB family
MKKIVILIITVCSVLSCNEDLLITSPKDNFSDLTVFDNIPRVEQQVNGLYATVKHGDFLGGRNYVYHEIRCENFLNETANIVTGFSVWNHTVRPENINDVTNYWNQAYLAINRINVFLDGIEANATKLKSIGATDIQLNEYRAEARFLRGLSYFSLLQLYAAPFADGNGAKLGLPLLLKGNVASGDNNIERSTVATVYAEILKDLNFAEENLPNSRSTPYYSTVRAIKTAPIALKTRIFLHLLRYNDVIAESKKLVSDSAPFKSSTAIAHSLAPTVAILFSTPYTHSERIFNFPFTPLDLPGQQSGLGSYYNPGPRGVGDFSLNPNGLISDTINWQKKDDRRKFIFLNTNNKNYWNKFSTGPQHLDFVPVLRYAEVLLNYSEAIVRTNGNLNLALALLNEVRKRSNSDPYPAFSSSDKFLEAILIEKQIEFLGEGFRGIDLQRQLKPLPGKLNIGAVPFTSPAYLWPLPTTEVAINKVCVQNPGY